MWSTQIPLMTAHLPPAADGLGRGEGPSAPPLAVFPAPPHLACLPANQTTCRAGPNPAQGGGKARCRPGWGESHLGVSHEHLSIWFVFAYSEPPRTKARAVPTQTVAMTLPLPTPT